ncbi:hypothetical protein DD549_21710 [Shewanella algae]|nr:hypothetical protein DD549_21710 [Shewanella algae]
MLEGTASYEIHSCSNCLNKKELGFDFSMAFQPIINIKNNSVFGYEALVRGLNNEAAGLMPIS